MHLGRKTLSVLLTLAMLCALLPMAAVPAAAVDWTGDMMIDADETIGSVSVTQSMTLTVNAGVTLTVNGTVTVADGKTLTVAGPGALVVNGADGIYGMVDGTDGDAAVIGSLVVNGGTVTLTGGNASNYYTNGGSGMVGSLTVNGGTVTVTGGSTSNNYSHAGHGVEGSLTVNGGRVTISGGTGYTSGDGGHGVACGAGEGVYLNGGNVIFYGGNQGLEYQPGDGIHGNLVLSGGSLAAIGGQDSFHHQGKGISDGYTVTLDTGVNCFDGNGDTYDTGDAVKTALSAGKTLTVPVTTWSDLKTALETGGMIALGADVTAAADGDEVLTVPTGVTATVDLKGHTITGNWKTERGTIIAPSVKQSMVFYVSIGGDLTVRDSSAAHSGKIVGDNSEYGVYVDNDYYPNAAATHFTLAGGTISGNHIGVFVETGAKDKESTFIMTGGAVSGNTESGLKLSAGQYEEATMSGGTISGNGLGDNGEGGVIMFGGTFTMTDGAISGNGGEYGGVGIEPSVQTAFTMTGGAITGNTGSVSGGVYAGFGNTTALIRPSVIVSGTAQITGNVKGGAFTGTGGALEGGTPSNVYLAKKHHNNQDYNTFITVTGALETGAAIGVTLADDYVGKVFTNTESSKLTYNDAGKFSSDSAAYIVGKDTAGQLLLGAQRTVTYNYTKYGGTSATKSSDTVAEGAAIDLTPTATRDGWTFVGWNTDQNATSALTSLAMGSSDVTLYAIYSKTLTGTFYSGANNTEDKTVTIYNQATGGIVTAPALKARDGWTPVGWNESDSAYTSGTDAGGTITLTADKSIYGVYSQTVTVSYYTAGADTTPPEQSGTRFVNVHASDSFQTPSFTLAGAVYKIGADFEAWHAGSEDGTPVYPAGQADVELTASVTLYAGWTPWETVAKPTFSLAPGEYTEAQSVTAYCATADAEIYVIVGDAAPVRYSGPITVSETVTLKAYAVKAGMLQSDTAEARYTISKPAAQSSDPVWTPSAPSSPAATPEAKPEETRFDPVDTEKGGSPENFSKTDTYTPDMFDDVTEDAWYAENIKAAVEYGILKGKGDSFGVGEELKLSEALAIAARLHNLFYGGSGEFDQSQDKIWYQVYEDYAIKYGFIAEGQYDMDAPITRAQFALIIAAALPDTALEPINTVTALPDVAADDPRLPAILRLYNAGILTGVDGQGSFAPDAPISREQIAAVATRVVEPSLRKALALA